MMVLLCVMDGFGLASPKDDNAVAAAFKPNYDSLIANCPHTALDGSGEAVGLPSGQMGNSEVGHLNLGAGRIIYQDITKIDLSIKKGDFFSNRIFTEAFNRAVQNGKAVHLFGLVSDGKVHSSLDHLYALIELAKRQGVKDLYLHAFLDGRDTPPDSGIGYMTEVLEKMKEIGLGKVATIGGRYYGMDRDRRWERTERAYRGIVYGEGKVVSDPIAAIKESYANGITDEFIEPVIVKQENSHLGRLHDGDAVIMFNFRADRMRQLAYLFSGLELENLSNRAESDYPKVELITMTGYDTKLVKAKVAYHRDKPVNILAEILAKNNLRQLRTAETEKYAHVTFFFNGGNEKPFPLEDRDLVPSPKVATYDLQPEMSSVEVTDNIVKKIDSGNYEFVLINYANCDMVGHTGIFDAAKRAVEAVDRGLGRVLEAVKSQKGVAIITADHGNAEMMINPETGGPWTAHTTNLVPCIIYDPSSQLEKEQIQLRKKGILADIAPTILDIFSLDVPNEMTGQSLLKRG